MLWFALLPLLPAKNLTRVELRRTHASSRAWRGRPRGREDANGPGKRGKQRERRPALPPARPRDLILSPHPSPIFIHLSLVSYPFHVWMPATKEGSGAETGTGPLGVVVGWQGQVPSAWRPCSLQAEAGVLSARMRSAPPPPRCSDGMVVVRSPRRGGGWLSFARRADGGARSPRRSGRVSSAQWQRGPLGAAAAGSHSARRPSGGCVRDSLGPAYITHVEAARALGAANGAAASSNGKFLR